jgi:hypothetical protein
VALVIETRSRRRLKYAGVAAVMLALVGWRLVESRAVRIAVAPTRVLEARVSWRGADRWRPYSVPRAAGPAREPVPIAALAALERRRDPRGLAAGWLLSGEPDRAATALEHAGASPDSDSDRAVVALARGQLEEALVLLDRALAVAPRHAQALWNRGLVLRQLGLLHTAAKAFDDVAALGEPGWRDEARQRAQALRALVAEPVATQDRITALGLKMVATGALPSPDEVRTLPGLMRHYLYHAVRAAPSTERVRALLPVAVELDRMNGETRLAEWVRAAAARDLSRRAPWSATYARLVANPKALRPVDADAYVAALEQAHEDDLLLGVLLLLNRAPQRVADYEALAQRRGDPWFIAIADRLAGEAERAAGRFVTAEQRLRDGDARCRAGHVDYQCASLELALAKLTTWQHRTSEARRIALAALPLARNEGVRQDAVELPVLYLLGDLARCRNAFSLMRAYLEEPLSRQPTCEGQRYVHEQLAIGRMFALDVDGAGRELAQAPRCGLPVKLPRADLIVGLARAGAPPPDAATLPADLTKQRPAMTPGNRATVDVLLGRLYIDGNRQSGRALVEQALVDLEGQPSSDVSATRARTLAHITLAVDDARHGEHDRALAQLATAMAATAPRRCALGVTVDDERAVAVARDADGKTIGRYLD